MVWPTPQSKILATPMAQTLVDLKKSIFKFLRDVIRILADIMAKDSASLFVLMEVGIQLVIQQIKNTAET